MSINIQDCHHVDLIIVGAGPAGLSAAISARSCGLDVIVLDDQGSAGGQLFRNIHLSFGAEVLDTHDRELGLNLIDDFHKCGATFFPNTTVWAVEKNTVFCTKEGKSHKLSASKILFTIGGMERPSPFKGWTLPGVMTVGAAEVLLRSGLEPVKNKEPVVLIGNGPLMLALATHLIDANIPILAWLDTGRIETKLESILHMGFIFQDVPYLKKGMDMALKILKNRTPIILGATDFKASGKDKVETIRYKKNNEWHELKTSVVLRHENIIPRVQVPSALGVDLAWDKVQRYWYPKTDLYGRTNVNDIYITGDAGTVDGGEVSIGKGYISGIAIAKDLGIISEQEAKSREKSSLQKMKTTARARKYLRYVFAPKKEIYNLADDVLICRCENVTVKDIKEAVKEGFHSSDEVKRMTRIGMGACQGRMCGNALAEIIAQELGLEADKVGMLRSQQPFRPVNLEDYVNVSLSKNI